MSKRNIARAILLLSLFAPLLSPGRVSASTCAVPPEVAGTSRTSLDWSGFYWGILPCKECSGVETLLNLRPDSTFRIERRNVDNQFTPNVREGVFEWQPDNVQIVCRENNGEVMRFVVGEDRLYQLDGSGRRMKPDRRGNRYIFFKVNDSVSKVPNAPLVATYWKLTKLLGKPVTSDDDGPEIHMIFKTCSSRVVGSSGCNDFFGKYEIRPVQRISFSGLGASLETCKDMSLEQEFFEVLEMVENYTISGNTLQLNRAGTVPLARFEAVKDK
jgi:copper homeostasis protein (lipoprotein)